MSTPQATLYNLQYKINDLCKKFECQEDEEDIFENIKNIIMVPEGISRNQNILENQMNLIIKLLTEMK